MSSEEDEYNVVFEVKKKYRSFIEFVHMDELWQCLREEWRKEQGTTFPNDDLGYFVHNEKPVLLSRIQNIGQIKKSGGRIRKMTKVEKNTFIRDERIEKPQQLVNECFEISALRKVELKWRCFIGLFLVRRSSMKRSDLNYLPSARDEMHKIVHILDSCTKRHKIRSVPFNSDLDPKYSTFNTTRLKEYISEAPRFLHFIGHGKHYQLIIDNKQGTGFEMVNGNYVLELIKNQHSLECVFLNCCNSYVIKNTYFSLSLSHSPSLMFIHISYIICTHF